MHGLPLLLDLAVDLTRSMVASDRYGRLLAAVRRAVPCDATTLLRLEGDQLVPLATHGLVPEAATRRFRPAEHPRLQIICASDGPVRFPADSALPDPFDGLVEGDAHALDDVHSCLGCPLRIEGDLVGALTADALAPGAFDGLDEEYLSFLAALAAAAIRTNRLIELTESIAEHNGSIARHLMRERQTRTGEMIGTGSAMERLRSEIDLVAGSELIALITGETGVGKELVAHAIHDASPRRAAPLIHVNCAALPESIAESELFGHARGAFTGAERDRRGKLEVARGGTLFLDEVGELPLSIQPKLLRAIQEGEIQRVGSDEVTHVDTRIIAATNRDLGREVQEGRFRSDLYPRLNVFPIEVPPLRHRREDIPILAGYFCNLSRRQLGTGPVRLTDAARRVLREFDWPGNVRELRNVVSRAVLRAVRQAPPNETVILDAEALRPELVGSSTPAPSTRHASSTGVQQPLRDMVDEFKRTVITDVLDREHGNWAAAARALGVHRANLHATAKRLGISRGRDSQ